MLLSCSRCSSLLPAWDEPAADSVFCPACGTQIRALLFPAAFVKQTAVQALDAAEGDARCYDHADKQAVAHCAECGRFVCQLCAVDFQGAVWCPACLAGGSSRQQHTALEQSRTLYDSMALLIAVGPILFWPLTILTAPVALYVAVRYWKQPTGLLRRSKWRMVLTIVIALVQMGGWTWLTVFLLNQPRAGSL